MSDTPSESVETIFPEVYSELRRIAHRHLRRERPQHTLDTTGLVHEAYLRLSEGGRVIWRDRAHFGAIASKAMRRILIDYARRRNADKRRGGAVHVTLNDELIPRRERGDLLLDLDEALVQLQEINQRMAAALEMRFFGGMSNEDIAKAQSVSIRTIERDWRMAKGYVYRFLQG